MTDLLTAGHHWPPPAAATVRGTLLVLPGRGEHGGVYERFGRRLAADAYAVHALDTAPDTGPAALRRALRQAAGPDPVGPVVLVGADTGALQALATAADPDPELPVHGVILAGTALPGTGTAPRDGEASGAWDAELAARTACPVHRGRLTADPDFVRGDLFGPVPGALLAAATIAVPGLPVLLLHGDADPVAPAAGARELAARLPGATLAVIHGGVHDTLNDASHRTAAATVVQWLERLRTGPELTPILTLEREPYA
jgi:alpha-beta hydrolase superfamily lysophospholipase